MLEKNLCTAHLDEQAGSLDELSVVYLTLREGYGEENRCFQTACLGLLGFVSCQRKLFLRQPWCLGILRAVLGCVNRQISVTGRFFNYFLA